MTIELKLSEISQISEKLQRFLKIRFPNNSFDCPNHFEGYSETYKYFEILSYSLILYEKVKTDKKIQVENISVDESKALCESIIKNANKLKKEIECIAITYPLKYFAGNPVFSDTSGLINKLSRHKIKNPIDNTSPYSQCLSKTFKSYSEIEKSHESILILSAFILNDLIESMKELKTQHRPRKGNAGRVTRHLNEIIICLGYIFFECKGERPEIKRNGSGLSEKYEFSKMILDFEDEFDVSFNYSYAQKKLESITSFKESYYEGNLEYLTSHDDTMILTNDCRTNKKNSVK